MGTSVLKIIYHVLFTLQYSGSLAETVEDRVSEMSSFPSKFSEWHVSHTATDTIFYDVNISDAPAVPLFFLSSFSCGASSLAVNHFLFSGNTPRLPARSLGMCVCGYLVSF